MEGEAKQSLQAEWKQIKDQIEQQAKEREQKRKDLEAQLQQLKEQAEEQAKQQKQKTKELCARMETAIQEEWKLLTPMLLSEAQPNVCRSALVQLCRMTAVARGDVTKEETRKGIWLMIDLELKRKLPNMWVEMLSETLQELQNAKASLAFALAQPIHDKPTKESHVKTFLIE